MNKAKTICLIVLMILVHSINGQESLFFNRFLSENIIIEKGLSQNTVYTIFQDDEGFMWFGTWEGLNRFDGYSFVTFNREQGLSNETIRDIYQQGDILWVGTENGLNAIHLDDGSIDNYFAIDGDDNSLINNWVNHITADKSGNILIATAGGLSILDAASLEFRQFLCTHEENPTRSNYIHKIIQDEDENYWLATSYGLIFYNHKTGETRRYLAKEGDHTSLPDNFVNTLLKDDDGKIWVGTRSGMALFQASSQSFYTPSVFIQDDIALNKKSIQIIHQQQDQLWIGTAFHGLFVYDMSKKTVINYTNNPNQNYTISDNRVFDIFSDKSGTIWVGTFNGLNKLNHLAPNFRTYPGDYKQFQERSFNSVWCFEEGEDGQLWIGTEQGVKIWDTQKQSIKRLQHDPANKNSISSDGIRDIHRDKDGNYWIATRNNGLNLYNPKTNRYTHFSHRSEDNHSLPDNFVLAVQSDSKGNILVGTNNGLGIMKPETNRFKVYRHHSGDSSSLASNRVYDILEDRQKRIWVCSLQGLSLFNPENGSFKNYQIPEEFRAEKGILRNQFFSIIQARDNKFWIGTYNSGLVRFDAENESFEVWTTSDGLPNNVVYQALEDKNGHIWLSTNWGLTRFAPQQSMFTNYDITDGLQSNEFNFNAGKLLRNGNLIFGGMSGFNYFDPDEIFVNTLMPEVRITSTKIFNETINKRFRSGDTLMLQYSENVFSFEFAALEYSNPARIKYQYKLENFNREWIERKATQRYAEFAHVSPGHYIFKVKASNSDGFWSEEGIHLHIIINPPWYQSWWFRILALLLIGFFVYGIVHLRTRVIRRKHEVQMKYLEFEKKLFALEQKALQLQMNPHFLFNSLNSIQSFIVRNDIDNAIHYLSKFSKLMRITLSNSRESFVSLRDELMALQLYLEIERLRFNDNFEFEIKVDPSIDDSFLEIPPMLLQPYVENAVIHGLMHKAGNGYLRIDISQNDDNLLVLIEDNGVGREKAEQIKQDSGIERKSKGMLITGERLDILNQYTQDTYAVQITDLKDENGAALGTRVEIHIHGNMG